MNNKYSLLKKSPITVVVSGDNCSGKSTLVASGTSMLAKLSKSIRINDYKYYKSFTAKHIRIIDYNQQTDKQHNQASLSSINPSMIVMLLDASTILASTETYTPSTAILSIAEYIQASDENIEVMLCINKSDQIIGFNQLAEYLNLHMQYPALFGEATNGQLAGTFSNFNSRFRQMYAECLRQGAKNTRKDNLLKLHMLPVYINQIQNTILTLCKQTGIEHRISSIHFASCLGMPARLSRGLEFITCGAASNLTQPLSNTNMALCDGIWNIILSRLYLYKCYTRSCNNLRQVKNKFLKARSINPSKQLIKSTALAATVVIISINLLYITNVIQGISAHRKNNLTTPATTAPQHIINSYLNLQDIGRQINPSNSIYMNFIIAKLYRYEEAKLTKHLVLPYLMAASKNSILQTNLQIKANNPSFWQQISLESNLFSSLKTYLMLSTQHKHLDNVYILKWLQSTHQADTKKRSTLQLGLSINQALKQLSHQSSGLPADTNLIHRARATLNQNILPSKMFIALFSLLKLNPYADRLAFTAGYFNQVYNHDIPSKLTHVTGSLWVYNDSANKSTLTQQAKPDILSQLRAIYIGDYIRVWQEQEYALYQTYYRDLHNPTQSMAQLTSLHSDFRKQLNKIHNNTSAITNNNIFNQTITPVFSPLMPLYTALQQGSRFYTTLNSFGSHIRIINSNPHNLSLAFNYAVTQASTKQSEIRTLLDSLSALPSNYKLGIEHSVEGIWSNLLQLSAEFINQNWQSSIYPILAVQVVSAFPFNPASPQQLSAHNFAKIFSRNGMLDEFFEYYLLPFVNTSTAIWQPKTLYLHHIAFSPNALAQFKQFYSITNNYFNSANLPYYNFILQPTSKCYAGYALKLNNYNIDCRHNSLPSRINLKLYQPKTRAQLLVHDERGITSKVSLTGAWSWLRLLTNAHISTLNNSNHHILVSFRNYKLHPSFLIIDKHHPSLLLGGMMPKTEITKSLLQNNKA